MAYAEKTPVSVVDTIAEIRRVIVKHGGGQFVFGVAEDHVLIGFTKDDRQIRMSVPQDPKQEQRNKSLCRALLLVTKAKLEAVAAGVSIFENEFLANIVLPDGKLVGQQTRQAIAAAYEGLDMPPLLPDYSA
jgi:hypothetical protein